jgi:hypothetical protein
MRALLLIFFCATAFADKGVALGLFAEDPGWSYKQLLDEIHALGADHVELVVAWYQKDVSSTEIGDHPRYTAPESAIRRAIREAHQAHLAVLLFPILRLTEQHAADEWRGTLKPSDRAAWFRSYEKKLGALAKLAAQEKVEELSIGSELSTMDEDHDSWSPIVKDVRAQFHGALTYSGNWDHFQKVAIYDLVDHIGLCGYFALGGSSVDDLSRTWRDLRAELERFAQKHERPLLFTEIGYLSQRGAAAWPWDEGSKQPVDLEDQRRCYAAFCRIWRDAPLLRGVYFWNWYGWGGSSSRGYTPRGKPAADEIRSFFK